VAGWSELLAIGLYVVNSQRLIWQKYFYATWLMTVAAACFFVFVTAAFVSAAGVCKRFQWHRSYQNDCSQCRN
jgi:hypothetical protein